MADAWNAFWDNWRKGVGIIGDNMKESFDAVGDRYTEARDHFQNNNILHGTLAGSQATFAGLGNIITLGGAHAIGKGLANTIAQLERDAQNDFEAPSYIPEGVVVEEGIARGDFGKDTKQGQDKDVKPPLSEEKFNENIDKIIEFAEKSRTHGYGGFDPDYAAARYLIEDMAERAGRDDVKPTEVIDTIKSLTDSGGVESQKQYLRGQLGPQTEKNSSRKVEDKDADKGVVAKGGSGKDTVKDIAPGEGSKSSQVEDKGTDKTTNPNRDDAALRAAFSDDVVDYKDEAPELDGSDGIDF